LKYKIHIHRPDNWLIRLLDFAFALGNHIIIPASWPEEFVERILPHEKQHVVQQHWLGFGIHPNVGIPLFLFLYFLVFLPVGLALFRLFFEYQADIKETEEMIKKGNLTTVEEIILQVGWYIKTISGRGYLYTCPKFMARWLYYRKIPRLSSVLFRVLGEQNVNAIRNSR